jgi:hypothetical protein
MRTLRERRFAPWQDHRSRARGRLLKFFSGDVVFDAMP